MKPRLNCLASIISIMSEGNQAPLLTCPIPCWRRQHVVGVFSSGRDGGLVRVEGKLIAANYRDVLNENLVQSTQDLRLGWRVIFQQDHYSKHTARTTQEWLRDNSINVLEWPSQSPSLNPIENGCPSTVPIQPDRALEDLQRIMAENPQI